MNRCKLYECDYRIGEVIKKLYLENEINQCMTLDKLYAMINDIVKEGSNAKGCRFKYNNFSPLEIEILMNDVRKVEIRLHDGNVDLNKPGLTGLYPLEIALVLGNMPIVDLLRVNGADANKGNCLFIASYLQNKDAIDFLVRNGIDVTRSDNNGFNALHYLLNNGSISSIISVYPHDFPFQNNFIVKANEDDIVDCIDILVDNGVDINQEGTEYKLSVNPLSVALERDYLSSKVIGHLIEKGALRKAIKIHPSRIYTYQEDFNFLEDIKDMDISTWFYAFFEYINYLKYMAIINKYDIEVYSSSIDYGYKRSKKIKALTKQI